MKKAKYTLFQLRGWVFIATLVCTCFSSLTINAQQQLIQMPSNSSNTGPIELDACNGTTDSNSPARFTDDGGIEGLYADDDERADTTTICPTNPWNRVKVVFTDFDLAKGDTLFAFQGNKGALGAVGLVRLLAASGGANKPFACQS